MTNEEIMARNYDACMDEFTPSNVVELMNLARADERAKIESERLRRITTNHLPQEYGLPYEVKNA